MITNLHAHYGIQCSYDGFTPPIGKQRGFRGQKHECMKMYETRTSRSQLQALLVRFEDELDGLLTSPRSRKSLVVKNVRGIFCRTHLHSSTRILFFPAEHHCDFLAFFDCRARHPNGLQRLLHPRLPSTQIQTSPAGNLWDHQTRCLCVSRRHNSQVIFAIRTLVLWWVLSFKSVQERFADVATPLLLCFTPPPPPPPIAQAVSPLTAPRQSISRTVRAPYRIQHPALSRFTVNLNQAVSQTDPVRETAS